MGVLKNLKKAVKKWVGLGPGRPKKGQKMVKKGVGADGKDIRGKRLL